MADNNPNIKVLDFKTTYENRPKRGTDPLNDEVDAKGYLIDAKGNRIMERAAEDWVIFAPAHSPINTHNVERIRNMIPDPARVGSDPEGVKLGFMTVRWQQIEPAYAAWKKGQELPVNGMALSAYPGLNEEQVRVLRSVGIRTIEELRDLSEIQVDKVPLPSMRETRKQAGIFLENLGAANSAEREAAKDREMEAMRERLAAMEALLDQKTEPTVSSDDEVAQLRAELDTKGITYDGRWAAPKLRSLLQAEAA